MGIFGFKVGIRYRQTLISVWYETPLLHSASVENVKFEAYEVFEARELAFANDCFKHEYNEEIGVLYQALIKPKALKSSQKPKQS